MNKQSLLAAAKYAAIGLISLFLLGVVAGGGIFLYQVHKAPALSEKKLVATTSSKIYDSENNLIADLGSEKRVPFLQPSWCGFCSYFRRFFK